LKKVFYSLIVFLSLFIFSNNANAGIFDVKADTSCYYRNETKDATLVTYTGSGTGTTVKLLDEFTLEGKTIKAGFKGNGEWKLAAPHAFEWAGGVNSIASDKCYQYILFDADKDNYYFTDNETDFSKRDHDLVFTLIKNYQPSTNNAMLLEMYCTYSPDQGSGGGARDVGHISFRITHDGQGNGTYEVLRDHEVLYTNTYKNTDDILGSTVSNRKILDHFSIRTFWIPYSDIYACPPAIAVGYEKEITTEGFNTIVEQEIEFGYNTDHMKEYTNDYYRDGWFDKVKKYSYYYTYNLQPNASYIDYKTVQRKGGELCNYTRSGNEEWYISLKEIMSSDGNFYMSSINEKYGDLKNVDTSSIPSGIIDSSCDNMPYIYTDCFTTYRSSCKVSTEKFDVYDDKGIKLNIEVEQLGTNDYLNSQSYLDAYKGMAKYNGYDYKALICNLKYRLNDMVDRNTLLSTTDLSLYGSSANELFKGNITNMNCDDVAINYQCDEECKNMLPHDVSVYIKAIKGYCDNILIKYSKNSSNQNLISRKSECLDFYNFYDDLVAKGIIKDLSTGCDFVSNDLAEKLVWVLDLLKIAGPILAIGLGTLDFIKVIATGDSDKEMKNAFKRFSTRILAAILLFIIPIILAFLMDTFIANKSGYNSDNPFCDVVEWED